jgi:hypothetical protein
MDVVVTRILCTLFIVGMSFYMLFYVWTHSVSINAILSKKMEGVFPADDKNVSMLDLERQKKESDPKVTVSLERKPGELLVRIRAERNVSTLALDMPVLGKIINIHDYNSVTDAETRSKRIVGENSDISSNNVELLIGNIKPAKELSYKILFRPLPSDVFVAGTDRYQISYTWQFAGNIFNKKEWISLQTGDPVDESPVQVKGFSVIKRALSAEEVKKLYEDGLKRRVVE